jgi:hypothetical protein
MVQGESAASLAGGAGEHKSLPLMGVDIVEDLIHREGPDPFLDQDSDFVDLKGLFIFLRLIQSQAQFGPASAKPLENNPKRFARMVLEGLGQFLPGAIGDFHGGVLSVTERIDGVPHPIIRNSIYGDGTLSMKKAPAVSSPGKSPRRRAPPQKRLLSRATFRGNTTHRLRKVSMPCRKRSY